MDENKNEAPKMDTSTPVTPPAPEPAKSSGAYGESYSKGGWKKWVIIYVIVAVVVTAPISV